MSRGGAPVHRTTVSVNRRRAQRHAGGEQAWEALQHAGVLVAHGAVIVPRSRRHQYEHDATVPHSAALNLARTAAAPPPHSRCRRYEHDAAVPRLAHVVAGTSTMLSCLTHAVATVVACAVVVATAAERDTPAAHSRPPSPP
jgi:hypothetical protein